MIGKSFVEPNSKVLHRDIKSTCLRNGTLILFQGTTPRSHLLASLTHQRILLSVCCFCTRLEVLEEFCKLRIIPLLFVPLNILLLFAYYYIEVTTISAIRDTYPVATTTTAEDTAIKTDLNIITP